MLCCLCHEDIEDENTKNCKVSWFEGYCFNCEIEIPCSDLAIRIPIEDGGWKGCYCSIECAADDYPSDDPRKDILFFVLSTNLKFNEIDSNQEEDLI